MNASKNGVVKWFNEVKGFGFITPDEEGPDVFVHYTGIIDESNGRERRSLETGQAVTFDVQKTPKGLQAINVRAR